MYTVHNGFFEVLLCCGTASLCTALSVQRMLDAAHRLVLPGGQSGLKTQIDQRHG